MSQQSSRPDPTSPAGPSAAHAAGAAGPGIVVIDDEPLNTVSLTELLCGAGYGRIQVLAGDEATIQVLRDEQPDLVLLDLAPAATSPYELLRLLRADRLLRHVPVIALASHDDRASRLRALDLGATDYLVKPVDAGELLLRVRNTLAAKAYQDQLVHTDQLTGLPNRESLLWRLDWALKHAVRHATVGAVLHFGLERFRQLNDALGPALVDELLHMVSMRLMAGLRDSDMVARAEPSRMAMLSRSGGDEFAVLLPVVERPEDAALVAQRLIERIAEPIVLAGHELFVTCRVGIAVFPLDSADKYAVLQNAGVAMHHARAASPSGSGFQFYSASLNTRTVHRLGIERELRHALERDELRLHYQPQVDTAGGQLCGAEALVRWQHPRRGLLGPNEFIGVAEESGLIVRLGDWVLREALRQLAAWRRAALWLPRLSVNVSSLQLRHSDLCAEVAGALESSGIEAGALCLELTESAVIDSGPQVGETVAAIKRLGVQLALDDFGTGYSSLTYLQRLPIDELKIDRSFVAGCDGDNAALAGAIIAMAHRLGLHVVAEGVETPQQLAFLRSNGANAFQGYLYAPPLAVGDFTALLGRNGLPQQRQPSRHSVSTAPA